MLVVLDSGSGQMCNQMLMQANVLASAIARGYSVEWYNFKRYNGISYKDDYVEDILYEKNGNPKLKLFVTKVIYNIDRNGFFKKAVMASDEKSVKAYLKNCLQKQRVFCYGWPFYDLSSLRQNANIIRNFFSPTLEVKKYVKDNMCGGQIIIGVHIRRGDYRTWRGGEFYFENKVYKHYMDCLFKQIESKSVHYILFSNEEIKIDDFECADYSVSLAEGTAIQDFYMQASCDYLIGPPSSYSGMASFLGSVPRFIITSDNEDFSFDRMRVWLMETDGWINPI